MLRGAGDLIDICRHRIHHDPHHLSPDGAFSWEEVECLGACVNAPMIQVSKDTYEDLTPAIFEALLDAFARGETPEPGPQNGRQYSMPITGLTSLNEIAYAADISPSRQRGTVHATAFRHRRRPSDVRRIPATPPLRRTKMSAASIRRGGRTRRRRALPAPALTRRQGLLRDTHQSGPVNPGAKSDRDSSNGGKEG